MKIIAVAFAFLLAGVSAWPSQQSSEIQSAIRSGEPRIVSGTIVAIIERIAQSIADAGLDPFNHEGLELDYDAPVPTVLNARGHLRGVNSRGLSNIVINRMDYALLASTLNFNIELPGVAVSVGWSHCVSKLQLNDGNHEELRELLKYIRHAYNDSAWNVNILSANVNGAFSGSVALRNIIVIGRVRVSIGIISGISIREMEVTVDVGSVNTNLNLNLQGVDVSAPLNKFLGETVPNVLRDFQDDINELVTIVARQIVEANL